MIIAICVFSQSGGLNRRVVDGPEFVANPTEFVKTQDRIIFIMGGIMTDCGMSANKIVNYYGKEINRDLDFICEWNVQFDEIFRFHITDWRTHCAHALHDTGHCHTTGEIYIFLLDFVFFP